MLAHEAADDVMSLCMIIPIAIMRRTQTIVPCASVPHERRAMPSSSCFPLWIGRWQFTPVQPRPVFFKSSGTTLLPGSRELVSFPELIPKVHLALAELAGRQSIVTLKVLERATNLITALPRAGTFEMSGRLAVFVDQPKGRFVVKPPASAQGTVALPLLLLFEVELELELELVPSHVAFAAPLIINTYAATCAPTLVPLDPAALAFADPTILPVRLALAVTNFCLRALPAAWQVTSPRVVACPGSASTSACTLLLWLAAGPATRVRTCTRTLAPALPVAWCDHPETCSGPGRSCKLCAGFLKLVTMVVTRAQPSSLPAFCYTSIFFSAVFQNAFPHCACAMYGRR